MSIKVLVGTLAATESEFLESRKSLLMQRDCEVNQYLIKDLNEYDAHNLLWTVFNRRAHTCDLIVKVDSDTVIKLPDSFKEVYANLVISKLDGVQLSLFDYFSQTSIYGVGFFLPHVQFKPSKNRLFADRAIDRKQYLIGQNHDIGLSEDIGFHCKYPNEEQSYRYGLHRWKKGQFELLRSVLDHWWIEKDSARGWALVGAILAEKKKLVSINYNGRTFNKMFTSLKTSAILNEWVEENLDFLKRKLHR